MQYFFNILKGFHPLFLVIFAWFILHFLYVQFTQFEKEIIIDEKFTYSNKGLSQSVSDKDNIVYVVSNSFFYFHFTSAEVFNMLDVESKYKVKGYGIRFPFLGWFPNIIKAEKI